ncbi:uncharacterized protein EI97DRAFT_178452 [Westerdykella ornata]|uniref:Zn(2)-C6 fungal-type domain-containing protein n=1 Tax=Westerdykella ornata TaxID=318751 RepID=A0A6A6JSA7_WESOR|nr:uncharacterized protein EI97DRAFT_178452 [Westerdykella ornata]KAF2279501.1 hypothetical protein EI97DRAFT_178452 [Westerdykella ornata]
MRASVACERCRSSKTKCVNDGPHTQCAACRQRRRECVYAPPSQSPKLRRDSTLADSPTTATPDSEAPRKRHKKTSTLISAAPLPEGSVLSSLDDPLSLPILTHETWLRLWAIFEQQFYADLPFLHARTFRRPLPRPPSSHFPPMVLLAFLALTSPFHDELVRQHPLGSRGARAVSLYYYKAAKAELGHPFDEPNRERIQAQLMLGLFNFAHASGEAWLWVGNAIRCAQALNLNVVPEKEKDHRKASGLSIEDQFIEDEITRRTFWSCFIMDRALCGGTNRPTSIFIEDITIQLPCSENAFNFGKPVKTARLEKLKITGSEDDMDCKNGTGRHSVSRDSTLTSNDGSVQWEMGNDEGPLCHYIRAMELYREVHQWFINQTRKSEGTRPPWHPDSTLTKFNKHLDALRRKLPDQLRLTPNNHDAYLVTQESAPYILIHMLHLICKMMPLREYIPANAINCERTGPIGPLDPPVFPIEQFGHEDYWKKSASDLFKACHDLTDLLYRSEKWNRLPETPLMMFAAYSLAQCGVYALHYHYMVVYEGYTKEDISNSLAILNARRGRWKRTADNWKYLVKWDRHLKTEQEMHYKARTESERGSNRSGGATDDRLLPVSEGGTGGGAEEYNRLYAKLLKGTEHTTTSVDDEGIFLDEDGDHDFGPIPIHALGKVDNRRPVETLPTRTQSRSDVVNGTPPATFTAINGYRSDAVKSDTTVSSGTPDTPVGNPEPSGHPYISPAPSGPSVTPQTVYGAPYRPSTSYQHSDSSHHASGYPQYHAESAQRTSHAMSQNVGHPQSEYSNAQYLGDFRPPIPLFNHWHNGFPNVAAIDDPWREDALYPSPYYAQYNQP